MKAKIVKVIEDYPTVTVYYASGVCRTYKTFWDVPETVSDFMNESSKVSRTACGKEYLLFIR